MKKEKKPKHFIQSPGYPGGTDAMKKYIRENLRYPKMAFEKKIEGIVAVKFDLNQDGKVTKTSIKHSLGHGCDEEAERVEKLLRFNPINNRRGHVTFHKNININFNLKNVAQKKRQVLTISSNRQPQQKKSLPLIIIPLRLALELIYTALQKFDIL